MPISWNEAEPSDSSGANLGSVELRSLKSTIALGLAPAMYWPGSGGASAASAGWPKIGTARPFYGTQSQVSAYGDGFLMQTSDTTRLFAVNSASTPLLGSSRMIEGNATPTANTRSVLTGGSGMLNSTVISYGVTYTAPPIVLVTAVGNAAWCPIFPAPGPSTTTFQVDLYLSSGVSAAASGTTVNWLALGLVAF